MVKRFAETVRIQKVWILPSLEQNNTHFVFNERSSNDFYESGEQLIFHYLSLNFASTQQTGPKGTNVMTTSRNRDKKQTNVSHSLQQRLGYAKKSAETRREFIEDFVR